MYTYINIYIYIEREREREIHICVVIITCVYIYIYIYVYIYIYIMLQYSTISFELCYAHSMSTHYKRYKYHKYYECPSCIISIRCPRANPSRAGGESGSGRITVFTTLGNHSICYIIYYSISCITYKYCIRKRGHIILQYKLCNSL